uniref:uncharacterized protein LOC122584867 n=1 Tax=Erigeron canadensis TaxID=72917 RepID=UPI001CB924E2|nr:uncharacterized protein LOC122584867 [Erigeron canadensis]
MGLVSISIRTHFLPFQGFPSAIIQDPTPDTKMTPRRRRILFTLATLFISILQYVLKRIRIFTTPKGKKAKILYGMRHHGLAILLFFDDHILIIEKIIETLIPSSTRVFDKIDNLLKSSESLPQQIEDFIDHDVPMFMQRIPFLARVFKKDEKEIVIDITCHGYRVEPENSFQHENVSKPDNVKPGICDKEEVMNTSKTESDFSHEK